VTAGVLQVTIFTGVGFGLAHALGFPPSAALMVGLVSAFSSTVVVVKLLERTGGVASLHGRLAIAILLVQDVLVAVALMFLGALAGEGRGAAT
jgi:predicted Kef-type K+ transport protein